MAANKLWFRARRYGWGWVPCSLEGWLVIVAFLAGDIAGTVIFMNRVRAAPEEAGSAAIVFLVWIAALVGALVMICWRTGERPHWNWGKRE